MGEEGKAATKGEAADRLFKRWLLIVVGSVWAFGISAAAFYAITFSKEGLSPKQEHWGQLGDYLGGVINPMIGIVTVGLLAWSMVIQRQELRASVREMKDSNRYTSQMSFEQALFTWLQSYHSQIASVEIERERGKKSLQGIYRDRLAPSWTFPTVSEMQDMASRNALADVKENKSMPYEAWQAWATNDEVGTHRVAAGLAKAIKAYEEVFKTNRSELDAPLRTLYRLFRWVDETSLPPDRKWHYCALIRAQLSFSELVILFYNGLTRDGDRFVKYANKYALFDNLSSDDPVLQAAKTRITILPASDVPQIREWAANWPYTPAAFDSAIAKAALGAAPNA